MKKTTFIIKCCIVLLPFLAFSLFVKNNLLYIADQEIPFYIWNKDSCNTKQNKTFSTVILGDSSANASYIPSVISENAINLALGGATSAECYYIFLNYLENNASPNDVFISFTDELFTTDNCFWTRALYSHRFSISENIELLKNAIVFDEPSIKSGKSILDYLSYQCYLPNIYVNSLINSITNQTSQTNIEIYDSNTLRGGRYIGVGQTRNDVQAMEYSCFSVAPMFDYYYKKIIRLCIENNCNVHLIKLPLPNNATFTDEYIASFSSYYHSLLSEFPSISVDWMRENYDVSYFMDFVHMNDEGALKFSLALKKAYPSL